MLAGLLLTTSVSALLLPTAPSRAGVPCMDASEKVCALINLSPEEPIRVAQVLKKAWMEGGVKRGLVGTVFVGDDNVQIACQGQESRLKSFAEWIETDSMLVSSVEVPQASGCLRPSEPVSLHA